MLWPELDRYDFGRSLWRELDTLQRDMNRLFSAYGERTNAGFPSINLWIGKEDAIVTAELPGVRSEDMGITVHDNSLTLSGSRSAEDLKEGEQAHRRERDSGRFSRIVKLPFKVDDKKVNAHYKNGVLEVTLPRAEEDKPKKIAVKAA